MRDSLKSSLRILRWRARRLEQRLRYGRLDAPVLFGNSFPKSGTHLLTQVLAGMTRISPVVDSGLPAVVNFDGASGRPLPVDDLKRQLERLRPGDISYGHLHAFPEVVALLCSPSWAPYFIYRDPRDVVVSHVFYVTEMEANHVHHEYYAEQLHSFEERLRVSILGRPELDIPFPGIAERFAPYLPWLSRPEVQPLRFEDFITQPEQAIGLVLDHAVKRGLRYIGGRQEAISQLHAAIDPKRSPTFRSGKVGGWRAKFDDENKALFKAQAGELLVQLGYEKDLDW